MRKTTRLTSSSLGKILLETFMKYHCRWYVLVPRTFRVESQSPTYPQWRLFAVITGISEIMPRSANGADKLFCAPGVLCSFTLAYNSPSCNATPMPQTPELSSMEIMISNARTWRKLTTNWYHYATHLYLLTNSPFWVVDIEGKPPALYKYTRVYSWQV